MQKAINTCPGGDVCVEAFGCVAMVQEPSACQFMNPASNNVFKGGLW